MKISRFKRNPIAGAIACGGLALAAQAGLAAPAGIQEVIVTAQKQAENIQTIPLAVTALTTDALTDRGITDLAGIANATPSLSTSNYPSSTMLILYMRGQGVSDPGQITFDGSVGLYVDGFYIARPQGAGFELADIERVEVLRGPQGTLYGRNTTGGAVNIISKAPTGQFGFKQTLNFGSRNLFRSKTAIDLPAWNGLATKLTLLKSSQDGYVKNTGSSHDFGEQAQSAGRFDLNWSVAPDFTVDYFLEYGETESTSLYYQNETLEGLTILGYPYTKAGDPRSRTYRPIDLEPSDSRVEGHGLTLSWDVSDTLTIKSLTGYRDLIWNSYQDYAESLTAGFRFPISNTADDLVKDRQFSQEFQFIGEALDSRINYVAGLYYFDEDASHANHGTIPTFAIDKQRLVKMNSKSKAAFGQLGWTPPVLDDRLELIFGARYTEDERSASRVFVLNGAVLENAAATGAVNDQDFSRFNPSFTANYMVSDDLSLYAKVSTGYKAGGSSESGPIGSFNVTFGPEKITAYELGMKSYWFDQRVRLNVAAFDNRIEDLQLAFVVDPLDGSFTQGYNAGEASIRGVEIELLVAPIEDLSVGVNYTYLDPEIEKIDALAGTIFDPSVNSASPYQVGDNIKDLFNMPYTAENSVDVSVDYTFFRFDRGELAAHLDYQYKSSVYHSAPTGKAVPNGDFYEQPSYGLLNGRITASFDLPRGDRASVSLWGKNLTDERYERQVIGQGSLIPIQTATGVRPAGYVSNAVIYSEPASYGIELQYEY